VGFVEPLALVATVRALCCPEGNGLAAAAAIAAGVGATATPLSLSLSSSFSTSEGTSAYVPFFELLVRELDRDIYYLLLLSLQRPAAVAGGAIAAHSSRSAATATAAAAAEEEEEEEEQHDENFPGRRFLAAILERYRGVLLGRGGWETLARRCFHDQRRIEQLVVDDLKGWPLATRHGQGGGDEFDPQLDNDFDATLSPSGPPLIAMPRYGFVLCLVFLEALWPEEWGRAEREKEEKGADEEVFTVDNAALRGDDDYDSGSDDEATREFAMRSMRAARRRFLPWRFGSVHQALVEAVADVNKAWGSAETGGLGEFDALVAHWCRLHPAKAKSGVATDGFRQGRIFLRAFARSPVPISNAGRGWACARGSDSVLDIGDVATHFLDAMYDTFLRRALRLRVRQRHPFTAAMAAAPACQTCTFVSGRRGSKCDQFSSAQRFDEWRLVNLAFFLTTIPDDHEKAYQLLISQTHLGNFLDHKTREYIEMNYRAAFNNGHDGAGVFGNVLH
jgi:hypothetical protein